MRYVYDYRRDHRRGAVVATTEHEVELLLQIGDPHLCFLVIFHDLICYWGEMWINEFIYYVKEWKFA
jgi:hypothetical protein